MQTEESLNPRFDKNIEALLKVNPLLAAQLKTLEVNKNTKSISAKIPLISIFMIKKIKSLSIKKSARRNIG